MHNLEYQFLKSELETLPLDIQKIILKQLEGIIREIVMQMRISGDLAQNLQLTKSCAKIYSVLDFVQKLKKDLDIKKE